MRRRERVFEGVPAELVTFNPSNWPAESFGDAVLLWRAAMLEWHRVHGWPGGPLDILIRARAARRWRR